MRVSNKKYKQKLSQQSNSYKKLSVCQRLIRVSSLIFALFIVSCQTLHTNYSEKSEGQWDGRALIKDHVRSKTYIAVINAYAKKQSLLRMDLISPIGGHMGSLLLDEKKVSIVDVANRTYYKGRATSKSLLPLLGLPINPKHLFSILFDEPIEGSHWACKYDGQFIKECENKKSEVFVKWSDRAGVNRTITISHKKGSMQINFKNFKEKIDSDIKFSIKIPRSFRKVRL